MAAIPPFQDYDDDDSDIKFRKNRWNYWETLKKVRVEYMNSIADSGGHFDAWDFEAYIEETYGIKMNILNGHITDTYKIVDEAKYLIFLLKYE